MKYTVLLFFITMSCLGEDVCCIRGYVQDYYGVPLIGATVWVSGTSLGAMTDASAHYIITNVPSGTIELEARMMVMGEESRTVTASPGDTLDVNFILASGLQYLPDISWKYNQEVYPDTVLIVVDLEQLDVRLSQIWSDNELMPSWVVNDSTIATALPQDADTISLRIFPGPQILISKPVIHDSIRVSYEFDEEAQAEYLNGDYQESHCLIDVTEWGNPNLINWGFTGSRVVYNENGSCTLLLVYNERAVLIDQNGRELIIEFPFPTFHFRTDPSRKHLLIWEICGREAVGGDAAIISLEDGSCNVFDPSPENEIPDRGYYSIGTVLAADWVSGWGMYHITSSGDFIRLSGSDIRNYSNYGELLSIRSLEDIGLNDNHYAMQFLSCGQEAVSGIYNDDSLNYCFTLDLDGNLIHQSSIPFPVEQPVLRSRNRSDSNSAVTWIYHDRYGMARVDCINGESMYIPEVYVSSICASQNRDYVGVTLYPDQTSSQCNHEIWDWNTGEFLYSFQEDNPSRIYSKILGISDTGLCLLSRTAKDGSSERIYAVRAQNGEEIWSFQHAPLSGSANTGASISPCGNMVTIPYGRYIDLVTLTYSE